MNAKTLRYFLFSGHSFLAVILLFIMASCSDKGQEQEDVALLFQGREYPFATRYNDTFYYTMQSPEDNIILYETKDLALLPTCTPKIIWSPDSLNLHHFWSPEIYRINNAWYIYFEADDGNTDNHQLYVIENTSENPMSGQWVLKGPLHTNDEWNFGLHPSVLDVNGELYLLWSGWPKRRVEHETQCIYIAHLENPWTVDSERVMLSQPEYEWERQWIDPDGGRSAYPIYVNENPQAYLSPNKRHVCLCYSASGIWTQFHILGMLRAPANANLLDPSVWTKSPEPIEVDSQHKGASNICIVPALEGDSAYLLYEALWAENEQETKHRSVFLKTICWDSDGNLLFNPAPR